MRALPRTALASILAVVTLSALGSTALAADALTVTVPYPEVVAGPGSKVTFDVTIKTTTAGRIDLTLEDVPSDWTVVIRGGGMEVSAVQTNGKDPVTASVEVTLPANASGGKSFSLIADGLGQRVSTALAINVEASAAGNVTLTTDVPTQKGTAATTFTFALTIDNSTSQDQTFSVATQAPDGWTASSSLTGSTQASSAVVKAGSTATVTVVVNPPTDVAAGQYPVDVTATGGGKSYPLELSVEITGSYTLAMSTPTQVLSNSGSAGAETDQQITLTNNGTAPITNVKMTATGPSADWKFDFDQPTIASIAAGQAVTVTAKVTPASNAIAGDYNLTFTANGDQSATATETIRFTVTTSIFGGVVAVLIVLLLAGVLWYVFRRYGRR